MKKSIEAILVIIPLLAPIPAAWVVLRAAMTSLGWPWPVAGIAALTIEGLGFVSVNLAQRMYTFNHTLRLDERSQKLTAPTWQAIGVTFLYLAVAITMITLLDTSTALVRYIPAAFPLLGITGAALWAIHAEQQDRQRLLDLYRHERRERRSATLAGSRSDARATLSVSLSDAQRRSTALYRCECGKTFADRYKFSGHQGRCAVHRQAKSGQPIPVDIPATTKQEKKR